VNIRRGGIRSEKDTGVQFLDTRYTIEKEKSIENYIVTTLLKNQHILRRFFDDVFG
jgi:hypothetical protein